MIALERAWNFDRDLQERGAARVQRFEQGAAISNGALPRVYDANFIRLDSALAELTADDAERLADALQDGLRHRKFLLPERGERLAADLGERGWTVTRTVVMTHDGDREPPAAAAEQVDPRAIRAAREAVVSGRDREVQRQLAGYTDRLVRANGARVFAAFAGGEVGAYCMFYENGGTGEIDEVTALEPFRRRGLGTAVVNAALAASLASGNDLTYLVAVADDWPRRWYERLGFRAIGSRYEVHRKA
jgi:ribosomal protein S18 acetylase RimI-like enzyme